ncbi:hypothetical protein LTR36_002855 [Oleoguttula mirabilis]|uniref:RING-type domain-containing protein n=1 Tax=Oleoguttula mirabilis TaxID=1507867 RepID=A0AAV9JLX1_9PEZI|nr:hypothetical protein LTR36_002855 [Oleoguttula mirabilis]
MESITFKCNFCLEQKTETPIPVAHDKVCEDCFKEYVAPKFEAALKHEHEYPVCWGSHTPDPSLYLRWLPQGFIHRWLWRERECRMAVKERVYCKHRVFEESGVEVVRREGGDVVRITSLMVKECGRFFGSRAPNTKAGRAYTCLGCEGHTCGVCSSSFQGMADEHVCGEDDTRKEPDAFEGMVRGRDYQDCPKCDVRICLRDGCNFVRCTQCRAGFCFICGMGAEEHDGDHWRPGNPCPRFNQPRAANVAYGRQLPPPLPPLPPALERLFAGQPALRPVYYIMMMIRQNFAERANEDPPTQGTLLGQLNPLSDNVLANIQLFALPLETETFRILENYGRIGATAHNVAAAVVAPTGVLERLQAFAEQVRPNWIAYVQAYERFQQQVQTLKEGRIATYFMNNASLVGASRPVLAHYTWLDEELLTTLVWSQPRRRAIGATAVTMMRVQGFPPDPRNPWLRQLQYLGPTLMYVLRDQVHIDATISLERLQHVRAKRYPAACAVIEKVSAVLPQDVWESQPGLKEAVSIFRAADATFTQRLVDRIERLGGGVARRWIAV